MTDAPALLSAYDGVAVEALGARAGAASVVAVSTCSSTMDLAHESAAAGAPHGTVIVAESQGMGRGRSGKSWVSAPDAGVWTSIVLRPTEAFTGGVLSLRVGLALAERLDAYAGERVQVKWPNDLYLREAKLAGILAEARWRGAHLEWIVVGVGVNVRPAALDVPVASLGATVRRADVLVAVTAAVLDAAGAADVLSADEMQRFASRDLAVSRVITAPLAGTVLGITADGGLRVRTADGDVVAVAGSLVFRPSDGVA
jgi:BirA family biotin operon repressor/biotin-[acetyl-CoA-carboxylase] ligase